MSFKSDVQQAFPRSTKQYVIYYYLEAAGYYLKSKQEIKTVIDHVINQ